MQVQLRTLPAQTLGLMAWGPMWLSVCTTPGCPLPLVCDATGLWVTVVCVDCVGSYIGSALFMDSRPLMGAASSWGRKRPLQ